MVREGVEETEDIHLKYLVREGVEETEDIHLKYLVRGEGG